MSDGTKSLAGTKTQFLIHRGTKTEAKKQFCVVSLQRQNGKKLQNFFLIFWLERKHAHHQRNMQNHSFIEGKKMFLRLCHIDGCVNLARSKNSLKGRIF